MQLTLPQWDVYFEQLLYPGEPIYNIGARISIEGHLDHDTFQKAYISLINQHDSYRLFLKDSFNEPEMIISEEVRPLELVDFSKETNDWLLNYVQTEFKKPFNIEKDNFLYRFVLIKLKENFHYLFFVCHHIVTDGWGTSLMFSRLVNNYNEILEHGKTITEYPFSYKNFVEDDKQYHNSVRFDEDKKYWLQRMNILPEKLFQKLRLVQEHNKSSRKELIITRSKYNDLIKLAAKTNSATFHVILAILSVYFGRKHQSSLFSIGLPILNRSGVRFKQTVGLFMGISPLLISINNDENFSELIERIKNQLRQDYRHQRFPIGQLIKELGAQGQKEKIFDITLSYERQNYSSDFTSTVTGVVPLSHESERVALAIYIREFDETKDVKIDFDYNLNYFSEESIEKVVRHFETLLEEVLTDSQKKISDLNFITAQERNQLLIDFNDTKVGYPHTKTIVDLFEEQVKKTPDHIAVRDSEISLTYAALNEKSNRIACHIISDYGYKNEPIGILVIRSAELVVLLLGILKSGRSYIPIDPLLPNDRIKYIINHSKTSLIIAESIFIEEFSVAETLQESKRNQVRFISKDELINSELSQKSKIDKKPGSKDTAYIIYTSGSTGNPKGVEIGHQALTNFLTSIQSRPGIRDNDTLYAVTTYSFDISILEFFAPLLVGGCTYVANKETLNNVQLLKEELERLNPSIIQATPSFYQMLFNAGWTGNKDLKMLCGGDSLNESLAEKLILHSKEVWNMYGPTETTIWSSVKKIEKPTDASNIGNPINNTEIYILDEYLNLLPGDTVGKIFIAGSGLAKGYYKNVLLTQEKFIDNPFLDDARMYDTGDLGKWLADGSIEFLGRVDFQVKIRGYRIELGEIETHVSLYSKEIKQVVADVKELNSDKILGVYYTTETGNTVDKASLRKHLLDRLPEYMIPGFFIELESFPLTPNGKVDRKALPEVSGEDLIRREYVSPGSEMEEKLVAIWQEILGVEKVGITDNFFELGGSSLNLIKLTHQIQHIFKKKLQYADLYRNLTIREQVKLIEQFSSAETTIKKIDITSDYIASKAQERIWVASQDANISVAHNMPLSLLIKGPLNTIFLKQAYDSIIQQYEILRTAVFLNKSGVLCQEPLSLETTGFQIQAIEFVSGKINKDSTEIKELMRRLTQEELDINKGKVIKVTLIKLAADEYILHQVLHHIAGDVWSINVLLNNLLEVYDTLSHQKSPKQFYPASIQYKDYTYWELNRLNSNNDARQFWEKQFSKPLPDFDMSRDFKHLSNTEGGHHQIAIKEEDYVNIKKFISTNQLSNSIFFTGLLYILFSKYTGCKDFLMGFIFAQRGNEELSNQVGPFINILPLRLSFDSELSLKDLIYKTKDLIADVIRYGDYPYELIKENIYPVSSNEINILLNVMNDTEALSTDFKKARDISLEPIPSGYMSSKFPLSIYVQETAGAYILLLEHQKGMYSTERIVEIGKLIQKMINELITNSDKALKNIELYTTIVLPKITKIKR